MGLPLYKEISQEPTPPRSQQTNTGLWFQRFFDHYNYDWSIPDSKVEWLKKCAGTVGESTQLQAASLSQFKLTNALQGDSMVYTSNWHFVTGMGNPHPIENGLSWHPTLGVPFLSGAAVKGLLRAWVEQWCYTEDQKEEKEAHLLQWFGSTSKAPKDEAYKSQTGELIFFDAIPTEPVRMGIDIMTPHMGKWYEKGDQIESVERQPERIPADWHDPTPIPFLTAHKISLLFAIAPRNPQAAIRINLSEVMGELQKALEWLGAGAKTSVGYGDMKDNKTHPLLLSTMPPHDQCRQQITILNDREIAEKFGKRYNKTKETFEATGLQWDEVLNILLELKRDVIIQWENKDKNSLEAKAFKKLQNKLY